MSYWDVMWGSLPDNMMIVIAAVVAVCAFAGSLFCARMVSNNGKEAGGANVKRGVYYALDVLYTLFITIISLFPLLGMFGTVAALINIGSLFAVEGTDMVGLKSEFFLALTSTAWGIVFSVIFKFVNAFFQPYIENQIDKAKLWFHI